jgi:hypothetical protein
MTAPSRSQPSIEHSPLPWLVEPDEREGYEWNIHIVERDRPHMRVCFMTSGPEAEANANLIVDTLNEAAVLQARGDLAVQNRNYWQAEAERRESEIAAIETRVAELEEALKPFAEIAKDLQPHLAAEYKNTMHWAIPTVGQLRTAADILQRKIGL